jgi:hypothetical protein
MRERAFSRNGVRLCAPCRAGGSVAKARLHTQWPGADVAGDPIFDQLYASQVESAGNAESLNRASGAAWLDKIGPAIILTHSQSGPFAWAIADARPHLVKDVFDYGIPLSKM